MYTYNFDILSLESGKAFDFESDEKSIICFFSGVADFENTDRHNYSILGEENWKKNLHRLGLPKWFDDKQIDFEMFSRKWAISCVTGRGFKNIS